MPALGCLFTLMQKDIRPILMLVGNCCDIKSDILFMYLFILYFYYIIHFFSLLYYHSFIVLFIHIIHTYIIH